jgi:hypothetical protein
VPPKGKATIKSKAKEIKEAEKPKTAEPEKRKIIIHGRECVERTLHFFLFISFS